MRENIGDMLLVWHDRDFKTRSSRGRTIAVIWDDQLRWIGVAECSKKDQFNKKFGYRIAVGRAKKQYENKLFGKLSNYQGGIPAWMIDKKAYEARIKKPVAPLGVKMTTQTLDEKYEKLQTYLKTMDIPPLRKNDLHWLRRNLGCRNSRHENFNKAYTLVLDLHREDYRSKRLHQ